MTKYLIGKIAYSVMCLMAVGLAFLVADTIEVFGLCLMLAILSGLAVVAIEIEEARDNEAQ
jgi:hypothetical protein